MKKSIFTASEYLGQEMKLACELAHKFLEEELHSVVLSRKSDFTFTKHSPKDVYRQINALFESYKSFGEDVPLHPIAPKNKKSSMNATTFRNKPGEIFFNVYRVNLSEVWEKVATLVHEFCHLAGFGHGNNHFQWSEKKQNSAPIWIANKAKAWALKEVTKRNAAEAAIY